MKCGDLTGVIPIVQMPFSESGEVVFEDLRREVEWLLSQDVDGIGFGYGSEIRRMTEEEIDRTVELTVAAVSGTVSVVAPIASGSEAAMIARAATMAQLGADALLAPPPHQARTPEGVVEAFERLTRSTDLPVVLQDAPVQTGVVLSVDAIAAIAQLETVVALKLEAPPTVPKIEAVVREVPSEVPVFGGAGGQDYFYELLSGAQGTMPGAAFPGPFQEITDAQRSGDIDGARSMFGAVLPLIAMSRRSSDIMCYTHKEIMRRRGIIGTALLRGPSAHLPESVDRDIDHALRIAELGLGTPLA